MALFGRCFALAFFSIFFVAPSSAADDVYPYHDFDFRNSLLPDSPKTLVLLPWQDNDRARVERILQSLYENYPGFVKQVAKYGHVPLYRVSTQQLDYINQPAYAGPIYVGFFETSDSLFMDEAVIHELTHIADTARQFANSQEWRALIEPHIARIIEWRKKNNISKSFTNWGHISNEDRVILNEAGLPRFYAASSAAEALADIVSYTIMSHLHTEYNYQPPADIAAYLDRTLFSKEVMPYPAGAEWVRGMALERQHKQAEARAAFERALADDPDFYRAKYDVALIDYWRSMNSEGRAKYVRSLQEIISVIPTAEVKEKLAFYREASTQLFLEGAGDALKDMCERVDRDYPPGERSAREYLAYEICGDAYYVNGELEKALAEYDRAIELVPFKRYEMTSRIGSIKMKLAANENDAWKAHDEAMTAQFKALAEKGQPDAMLMLGKMYFWGAQLPKDDMKAINWLTKAYNLDVADAAYYLAELYNNRRSDFYDADRTRYWAQVAVDRGDKDGPYILGLLKLEDGAYDEAKSLLVRAVETTGPRAAYQLGNLYTAASYREASRAEAEKWFLKAGVLVDAQYALGRFYLDDAPEKDPTKALNWFAKAATQGHPLSQFEIGRMASDAAYSGLPKEDLNAAYRWFYLSLHNTNPVKFTDLPAPEKEFAEQEIRRIEPLLGDAASAIKETLDAAIKKERAKRPWQDRTSSVQ